MRCCQSDKTINESIKPGVVGFMKRYTWRQLVPLKGVYDLSAIATDLDFLSSKGMQMIAMIEDKTFVNEQPLPQYLASLTVRNRQNGFTAVRWHPTVVDRMGELFAAIGEHFDSNPFFEGVALMESAPSVDNDLLDSTGYTPEKYRDALIDVMIAGAEGMPTSRVFWYMNYLPRKRAYLADVASAVAPYGIVMGGPDVMPDNQSLVSGTYPLYDQFAGQMPLFGQVEPICYSHPHADTSYPTKYWTMPELFKYARDNLNVNYMIWVRYPTSDYPDSYDWFDALPVMKNNPVFNQ